MNECRWWGIPKFFNFMLFHGLSGLCFTMVEPDQQRKLKVVVGRGLQNCQLDFPFLISGGKIKYACAVLHGNQK